MSDFSESYHIESANQTEAIATLQKAGLHGWVFPPGSGWTTLIPRESAFGEPNRALIAESSATLLYFMNAEDHGWVFSMFHRAESICHYECSWLDQWGDEVRVKDGLLDLDLLVRTAANHGATAAVAAAALAELLYPPDRKWLLPYQRSHGMRNVASVFADVMGLPYHQFLSADYLEQDEQRGDIPDYVVRV